MKHCKNFKLFLIILLITSNYTLSDGILVNDEVPIVNSNALPSPLSDNDTRFVTLYVPQDAIENPDEQFPVIYYFPGLGGDNLSFTQGNKLILDDLLARRQIVPFFVVHVDPSLVNGIDTDGKRRYLGTWYLNSELNGAFEDFIVLDLIPYIDANYNTIPSQSFRGVMGQSMGGFGASLLGTKHPELFVGMGSASGTPFWSIATNVVPCMVDPGSIEPPGDEMFVFNSLVFVELPTSGPNAGKILPENGPLTFSIFSHSAAHSPNVNNPPFFVDLPFQMNEDNTPVLVDGNFEISKTTFPGGRIPTTQSLVPRSDVIDRWRINNPFLLIESNVDTLENQVIYLDGGNIEIINAAGARVYSDKLSDFGIDHEYILYNGNHTDCLILEICSRHQTMFQMFSAKFSQAEVLPKTICNSITGTQTITLQNNEIMQITGKQLLCIETDPDNNITDTNVTIEIKDNAKLILGSNESETPQGGLQIGNRFSKARLEGDPTLNNHTISCTILVDGPNACLEIQQGGFLGLGAGVEGFEPNNINQWGVSSLQNVTEITIDVRRGKFIHNIMPTLEEHPSLFAVGLSKEYNLLVDPDNARIFGGGSVIGMEDNYFSHPVSQNVVGLDVPGGIRNNIDSNADATDFFYRKPMGSTIFYQNLRDIGLLASSGQLDNQVENGNDPFTITETIAERFCDRVAIDENDTFESLESKEALVTKNSTGTIELTYVDDNKSIICVPANEIEIGQNQQLDLENIEKNRGYADIVICVIDGKKTIIRVDDPEPTVL